MTGSTLLDVLIGLAFLYLLLSIVCSGMSEWVAAALSLRANNLEAAIRSLLLNSRDSNGKPLLERFYEHPLIKTLMRQPDPNRGKWVTWLASAPLPRTLMPWLPLSAAGSGGRPSYIPSSLFTLVLCEILKPASWASKEPLTVNDFWQIIDALPDDKAGDLKLALRPLAGSSSTSMETIRQSLEKWFNDAMERAAGWYKRKSWYANFVVAAILCFGLNIDSLEVARGLVSDPTARAVLVSQAEKQIQVQPPPKAPDKEEQLQPSPKAPGDELAKTFARVRDVIASLHLPIGWTKMPAGEEWLSKVLGLLATAIAVTLGSPLWFGVLTKLVNLRSSGVKPGGPGKS
jgi:hypothetical protein